MSTSAYQSPPFIDLQNLQLGLMASIIAKHEILVYNLLSNIAKAGDIPFDSLTILAC